jgi:putative transposase
MAVSFKGAHFPKDIILMGVRWYVAYPLSYPPYRRTDGGAQG